MNGKESINIGATPTEVFQLYRDTQSWAVWDPEVVEVHLAEGLQVGSSGWLKPRSGPKANIRIIEVTDARSFSVESKLPLCSLVFRHVLDAENGTTNATHWVEFSGPLSFLFRRLIGRKIEASLPGTMRGLKQACEHQTNLS